MKKDTVKRLLRYIGRQKGLLFLSLLLSAVSVICSLMIPILVGDAVDVIIG